MGSFEQEAGHNPNNGRSYSSSRPGGFALAAAILGGLSIISWCTGIIPVSAGAMGILFVTLSHRKGKAFTTLEIIGLSLSCIGLIVGLVFTLTAIITIVIPIMTDPTAFEQWNRYYESIYGISLEEILNSYNQTR